MPNKIKIALIIVAVVAVFSVYELSRFVSVLAGNGSVLGANISPNDQNCATCDPDHDGLGNAQEVAWGTDPFNPDTDKDGFKDGEEINSGHNPLVPGPNDLISGTNLTDQFSQLLVSGIYANALNPASDSYAQSLSDITSSLTDSGQYVFTKTVDPSSLTLVDGSTQNNLAYLKNLMPLTKQFGQLVGEQFKNIEPNLNVIGAKGFGDATLKSFFSGQASSYDTLSQTGTNLSVPSSFKTNHARFLELTQEMRVISDAIAKGESDPIKASMALNALGSMYNNYLDLLLDYKATIESLHLDPAAINGILQ